MQEAHLDLSQLVLGAELLHIFYEEHALILFVCFVNRGNTRTSQCFTGAFYDNFVACQYNISL